jgi:hypothetical protein
MNLFEQKPGATAGQGTGPDLEEPVGENNALGKLRRKAGRRGHSDVQNR